MDMAPDTLSQLMRRVPPAEVARLVRLLESRFESRETAQVPAQERTSDR
jgi:hypothetical protein